MLGSCLRLDSLWLCLPHAGKGHCFRGLTLSHTPHYGYWMGPGGVISGRHLRFSALDYSSDLCCLVPLRSIYFTGKILKVMFIILNLHVKLLMLLTSYNTSCIWGELTLQVQSCCPWTRKSSNSLNPISVKLFITQWLNMYVRLQKNR